MTGGDHDAAIARAIDDETLEWYRLTPQERWAETLRLWSVYEVLSPRREEGPQGGRASYFYGRNSRRP